MTTMITAVFASVILLVITLSLAVLAYCEWHARQRDAPENTGIHS